VGESIQISIIVPTKNEELTISKFIEWGQIGIKNSGLRGEIILLDNSSDSTSEIASKMGVTIIKISEAGLGRAYKEAKKYINGNYIFQGDADCTYDFRDLKLFIDKIDLGYDLVIGSRFKGRIERGAMPFMHRYFGTPITNFIFKLLTRIRITDIHCGMRCITKDFYNKLNFNEPGWEYASEMIIDANNLGGKITEVPINFYRDMPGRVSHQIRNGFLTPFKAGWGTLRVIFKYSSAKLLSDLGKILVLVGFFLSFTRIVITLNSNAYLNGIAATLASVLMIIIGSTFLSLGTFSKIIFDRRDNKSEPSINFNSNFNTLGLIFVIMLFVVFIGCLFLIEIDNSRQYFLIFQIFIILCGFLSSYFIHTVVSGIILTHFNNFSKR
jgi:glycosyltransferase involved in cell wall biosynthesis